MRRKTTTIEDVIAYYRDLHQQLMEDHFGDDLPENEKKELQKKYNKNVSSAIKNGLSFQKQYLKK